MKTQSRKLLKIGYLLLAAYALICMFLSFSRFDFPAPLKSTTVVTILLSSLFDADGSGSGGGYVFFLVVYYVLLIPALLSPITKKKKGFFFTLQQIFCMLDAVACMFVIRWVPLVYAANIALDVLLLFLARQLKRNVLSDAAPESDAPEEPKDA